jgi:hypothetical protein
MDKRQMISRQNISLYRMVSAGMRRIRYLPHSISWELFERRDDAFHYQFENLRDAYRGKTCFVLGNGPSLRQMDLQPLEKLFTFGMNRIYLLFNEMSFTPSFYVCINPLVIQQSASEISGIRALKFINWSERNLFIQTTETIYLRELFTPVFSTDLRRGVWGGATVTFVALQIAYFLGFQKVILIGVDHRFKSAGPPHKIVTAKGPDEDHFHPKYFANGTKWQLPDLETSEIAFTIARDLYETNGRIILDATLNGALDVFPKADYQDLLRKLL